MIISIPAKHEKPRCEPIQTMNCSQVLQAMLLTMKIIQFNVHVKQKVKVLQAMLLIIKILPFKVQVNERKRETESSSSHAWHGMHAPIGEKN